MSNSPCTIDASANSPEAVSRAAARLVLLFLANTCLPSTAALAHPEGFSGMQVTINADQIQVAITVHTRDLDAWFPPGKYPNYVADVTREMERTADEIVELQIDGDPQMSESVKAFLLEVGLIEIDVAYPLPDPGDPVELLVWSKHLIRMPRGHQQLLFVEDRRQIASSSGQTSETLQGVMRLDDVLTIERDAAAVILPPMVARDVSQSVAPLDFPPVSEGRTIGDCRSRQPRRRTSSSAHRCVAQTES